MSTLLTTPEFEDERRKALLEVLAKLKLFKRVSSPVWAFLWYSDIGKLSTLVAKLKEADDSDPTYKRLTNYMGISFPWDNVIAPGK